MTAVDVPADPPLGEIDRLTGIFFSPMRTFADIVARPRWYIPIILLVIAALALVSCYSHHIGLEHVFQKAMDQSSRAQSMSAEQRAQAFQMWSKFGPPMAYVTPIVSTPASLLIIAAVLMLIVNALFSAKIGFDQMAALTAYSFLPQIVSTILAIVVMFLKDPDDFDLRNPLAFNIGAYLGDATPKWLMSLATSFDLFSFWTIALLAAGIVVATRKKAWGKALFTVLAPWLLVVVVKAGWAAIAS